MITLRIKFRTELEVNLRAILKDCLIVVAEDELLFEINSIVIFWSEQRLHEDGAPIPVSTQAIREHLIENGLIIEFMDEND
ncbi:hypothetical protein [Paenibacillus sp. RC67]|uniref:hypothetical protein n=1 Tax=Paenibacillus sp. RC67 TaxID=3039392 RepID=UPI0024AE35A6|nr:hypothetical protein [Paenibacillus sp. RC67]